MEIAFSLLSTLLIPVAVIVGVVLLVRRARGDDEEEPDEGIGGVRRAFLYGLAFVSLIFAGVGVSMLLGGTFEALRGDRVIADSDTQLAVALAFTVVGVPSWVLFAALAQRSLGQHAVEARSSLRWLYFAFARAVALAIVLVRGVDAVEVVIEDGEFDGGAWGWALTWLGVWALHEFLARRQPATAYSARLLDRSYRYFGAVVGLCVFGAGLISALSVPALRAYDSLATDAILDQGDWIDGTALAALLLGGAAWWWHWFADVRRDHPSTLWDVYVFLFGILPGVAMAVSAGGGVLFLVLEWFIGDPGAQTASAHFRDLPQALPFLVIGVATWTYHRLVLSEVREADPTVERTEPERLYRYLVAAAGLLTLAAGLTTLFALVIEIVTPSGEAFRDGEWWRNDLVAVITLLAVGGPLWARYWFGAQARIATDGAAEVTSPSRRFFLFGVFGVAILVTLVNLVILLFEFFDAILAEGLGAEVVRDARWSIAMLLTAGATSVYYWLVLREHQEATPEAPTARTALREVVLIGVVPEIESLRSALERSGVRVRVWRRADLEPTGSTTTLEAQEVEALVTRLLAGSHGRVAVILRGADAEVIPFEVER